jgi:hypothetical protein
VFEICAHLFLNCKPERKNWQRTKLFYTFVAAFATESNTENSKHQSEMLLMHSVTELNSSPSSFQCLLVGRMWRVEQEKNSRGRWCSREGCKKLSLKSKWVSSVVLLLLLFRMCSFWISARPNNCLYWCFWWIFSATSVICPDVTLKISYTFFHVQSVPIISYIVAGTSSVVKLQTDMKEKEYATVEMQWGTTFPNWTIQININERNVIQIIILFHIKAVIVPEITEVNLLSDNWQHIFSSYLKFILWHWNWMVVVICRRLEFK